MFFLPAVILLSQSLVKAQGINSTEPSVDNSTETVQNGTESNAEIALDCSAIAELGSYSIPWHIGGLFIVIAVSALGVFGSLLLGYASKKNPFLLKVIQLTKMFGIGVIASTVWIHLIPEAFGFFSNPCLDSWWAIYETKWVGVFALLAAFLVQLIEVFGHDHMRQGIFLQLIH